MLIQLSELNRNSAEIMKRNKMLKRLISEKGNRFSIYKWLKGGSSVEYLVKRAQKKDDQAFVQLIEMVKGDLYKVARSYLDSEADIADAIQDTIIVCYEKIDSLKEKKIF